MEIRQCKMCDKLFQHMSSAFCIDCIGRLDEMFVKVRNYIYENPMADISQISKGTGVSEKYILYFLKQERLSINALTGQLNCDKCGEKIDTGRFCASCKNTLEKAFSSLNRKENKSKESYLNTKSKMHLDYK